MLPGPMVQSRHTQMSRQSTRSHQQPGNRDGPRIELQGRSNK
ncbi:hypothetical protein WP1_143 [Pseudomonas phage WP1]